MNHKWLNNKCEKCGIERQKKEYKRWQRTETVLKNGVWEDRHIHTYGIAWHYGKEHKFERPNCVPDFTSVFLCELRKEVKKGLLTNKNLKMNNETTVLKETEFTPEKKEYGDIIMFASDYRESHEEFDGFVSTTMLADMLIKFKRQFVDKDWYNAGIMAQRILQNDEIETLKQKLKQEEFNHINTRISWDSTTAERDELKNKNRALEERIVIITNNAEADRRQIAYAAWRAAADAFRMYPDNKHTFSDYWETVK